jgi:hypothetical protein
MKNLLILFTILFTSCSTTYYVTENEDPIYSDTNLDGYTVYEEEPIQTSQPNIYLSYYHYYDWNLNWWRFRNYNYYNWSYWNTPYNNYYNPYWNNPLWNNPYTYWNNPYWNNPHWNNPYWNNPYWNNWNNFGCNPYWNNPYWNRNIYQTNFRRNSYFGPRITYMNRNIGYKKQSVQNKTVIENKKQDRSYQRTEPTRSYTPRKVDPNTIPQRLTQPPTRSYNPQITEPSRNYTPSKVSPNRIPQRIQPSRNYTPQRTQPSSNPYRTNTPRVQPSTPIKPQRSYTPRTQPSRNYIPQRTQPSYPKKPRTQTPRKGKPN